MTETEARKIRSAFSNGYEYPFGGGLLENCDMKEVSRHADLLDDAIKKQIPQKPLPAELLQNIFRHGDRGLLLSLRAGIGLG